MSLKLTIGMATYDDFDGVYFSIQALRMYHPEVIDHIEIIVVDNNPDGPHGKCIRNLAAQNRNIKYIPFKEYQSTAIRNLIFENASAPYVLSMDCHVLFESGSIKKLIEYYERNPETKDLLQGPMVYDNLKTISSHFDPVWRAQMYGIWATDDRAKDPDAEPFEIPMQGLGVFSAKKDYFSFISFFHLRLYFYYPKKHKSDHNNKKRKSKFRVIESWQKKKEQYQLFGTIKENNCYVVNSKRCSFSRAEIWELSQNVRQAEVGF